MLQRPGAEHAILAVGPIVPPRISGGPALVQRLHLRVQGHPIIGPIFVLVKTRVRPFLNAAEEDEIAIAVAGHDDVFCPQLLRNQIPHLRPKRHRVGAVHVDGHEPVDRLLHRRALRVLPRRQQRVSDDGGFTAIDDVRRGEQAILPWRIRLGLGAVFPTAVGFLHREQVGDALIDSVVDLLGSDVGFDPIGKQRSDHRQNRPQTEQPSVPRQRGREMGHGWAPGMLEN